ncbi:acyl carrier protein [Streptomyces sp. NPDC047123]|uniref:acyl carrier protein n=1 Tax=Streptomyces sp. NPDC047123 TaxID=3155622 RepID=UPI0033EC8934
MTDHLTEATPDVTEATPDVPAAATDAPLPHAPGDAQAAALVVRRVWAEVLDVEAESIDVHQGDFFELGGYSLLALQAIGRILTEYGIDDVESVEWEGELLNRLFDNATPMAQAEFLAEKGCGTPTRTGAGSSATVPTVQ